jgi:hypothetical protein
LGLRRDVSRQAFFYKKADDRKKLIRRYFVKGLINWVCFIFFNKIPFKKVKELKRQKIKSNLRGYRDIKYTIDIHITEALHVSLYLERVPPQL